MAEEIEQIAGVQIVYRHEGKLCYERLPKPYKHSQILLSFAARRSKFRFDGFYTTKDRFVIGDEAYQIAKTAGQLLNGEGQNPGTLYAEDMW